MEKTPADVLDANAYPDLIELGGLAAALREIARRNRIDVGEVTASKAQPFIAASMRSARGYIGVSIRGGRRCFSVHMGDEGHVWARGGAVELLDVLRVTEMWRAGAKLGELKRHFPFMEYDRIAEAYENGDHVPVMWEILLHDEDLDEIRPLLLAAYDNERLRQLFPSVTMFSLLRFAMVPFDRTAGEVRIAHRRSGIYEVDSSWSETPRQVETEAEAVEAAVSLLP
jgi:hypothetical protein